MWLHEIPVGGLLVSPMVVFVLMALACTAISWLALRQMGWHRVIWKAPWFYLSLFVCYLALTLGLMS